MSERKLTLNIIGDASSLHKALGQAEVVTGKFGSGLLNTLKNGVLLGVGMDLARRGIDALGSAFSGAFARIKEDQRIFAQTDAVIKSTGAAAGVSRKQIDALSASLHALSGYDDMAIQKGQNLLLTFTNIRNETGKGNDIFNQATKSMLDMSVALGQDTKSSALQLGKALNDPIKGVSALQRVGVSFTEDQKKQIKTLVESGKTMEAQKLILAELNREFGGSAAAAGKTYEAQIARLKLKFETLTESIVQKLLPGLTSILDFVNSNWPAIEAVVVKVSNGITIAINALLPIVSPAVEGLKTLFAGFFDGSSQKGQAFKAVFQTVGDIVQQVVAFVGPLIQQYAAFIVQQFGVVVEWVKTNWPLISDTIKVVMGIIKAVFDTTWPVISAVVETAFNIIKAVVSTAIKVVLDVIKVGMQLITGDWRGAWGTVKDILATVWAGIKDVLAAAWEGFKQIFVSALGALNTIVSAGFNKIKQLFSNLVQSARDILSDIVDALTRPFRDAWQEISNIVSRIRDAISEISPFKRHSPSLVEQVVSGVDIIKNKYSELGGLSVARPMFAMAGLSSFSGAGFVGAGGATVQILITGNHIASDYDIERIGDELISHLRRKGVKL